MVKFLFSSKAAKIPNNPSKRYLLNINNKNTRRRCKNLLKHVNGIFLVFNVKFEHIPRLLLVYLLLTLSMFLFAGTEQLLQLR